MKIKSTKTEASKRINMCIYGPSGIGKTTLAGTLPGKTIILNAEGGLLSLQNLELDFIDINSWDDLLDSFKWLSQKEQQEKYEYVFLDSLTEISQRLQEHLAKKYLDAKDTLKLWKEYSEKMRACIKAFRDLKPYSVIFVALESVEKDENNVRYKTLSISGKIKDELPQYFDEVFAYAALKSGEEVERSLITGQYDNYRAKDRSGRLNTFEPPYLGMIINKIKGV